MAVSTEIIQALENARAEILENMSAKKINASGRTASSFRTEAYDGGFRLVAGGANTAPVPTLEIGRAGGKVPAGFYHIIKQWSRDKGIQFNTESERGTFAYFVAKKIAREGTQRNKTTEDVYSTPAKKAVGVINDILTRMVGSTIAQALGASGSTSSIKTNF